MINQRYSFTGQHDAYARYRPRWPAKFAALALEHIDFESGANSFANADDDGCPLVVSIGAGTGADAEPFLSFGCKVTLVEPNEEMLNIARQRLVADERATFVHARADDFAIPRERADLLIVAQAIHTFKSIFSGDASEERCRLHWWNSLKQDSKRRLSIWYYNPSPSDESTHTLHNLLIAHCSAYRKSGTPFLNAEFFKPYNFLPWLNLQGAYISGLLNVDVVRLTRRDLKPWLESYSFRPSDQNELSRLSEILCEKWFDRYSKDGILEIRYKGVIVQGALRKSPLSMPIRQTDARASTALEWPEPPLS